MRCLLLSSFVSRNSDKGWSKSLTILSRLLVGGVFAISGYAKGVDPWGTIFKMREYFAALGLESFDPIAVPATFILCGIEFLIGVLLFFGMNRRFSSFAAFAVMCFMLPFSLWIAVTNPVADCGCFGDFMVISNAATFGKNVALWIMSGWLVFFNDKLTPYISPLLQWIPCALSCIFIFCIEFVGYSVQPLVDFRPFKVGVSIADSEGEQSAPEFEFIYEKEGKQQRFSLDAIPDEADGWKFVDRVEVPIQNGGNALAGESNRPLHLWDGSEELSPDEYLANGEIALISIPELKRFSYTALWKIEELVKRSQRIGTEAIIVTSGSEQEIARLRDRINLEPQIYTADDTELKELVRGNPGVVLIRDGKIQSKMTLLSLKGDQISNPDYDKQNLAQLGMSRKLGMARIGQEIYLALMAGFVVITLLGRSLDLIHGDKVHGSKWSWRDKSAQ